MGLAIQLQGWSRSSSKAPASHCSQSGQDFHPEDMGMFTPAPAQGLISGDSFCIIGMNLSLQQAAISSNVLQRAAGVQLAVKNHCQPASSGSAWTASHVAFLNIFRTARGIFKENHPKISKKLTFKWSINLYQVFKVNTTTLRDFEKGTMPKVDFLMCNTFSSSYTRTNPQEPDTCMLLT